MNDPLCRTLIALLLLTSAVPASANPPCDPMTDPACRKEKKEKEKINWIAPVTEQPDQPSDTEPDPGTEDPVPVPLPAPNPDLPDAEPIPQPYPLPSRPRPKPRPGPNAPQQPTSPSSNPGRGADAVGRDGEAGQSQTVARVRPIEQKTLEARLQPLLEEMRDPGTLPDAGGSWPAAWAAPVSGSAPSSLPGAAQVGLDVLLRQGNYAAAERALTSLIIQKPDDALAYRYRAMVRRLQKDYTGALQDSTFALKLNPHDGWARGVRAGALVDLRRYPEAIEEANRAIEQNPADAKALVTRASAWKRLGRRTERLVDLRRAAELDPQFAALYNRALAEGEEEPSSSGAPARDSGAWALYGAAGGGLVLLLAGVGLLFLKSGTDTASVRTRPPMRLTDRGAPVPPPTLEGFEIIRKLGEGGMGIVYEAMDRTLRRRCALKQMRDHIASDPRQRRRFLREASTVASLRHPNIVEIHSAFESEGRLFLVFEYVAGECLNARLDRGPLPPNAALGFLRQIARALDYAHSKGIIHQDLKPGNIMVSEEGAKVMDFGIARRADPSTPLTTTAGEIVGTPFYMAPEQESGEPVPQSDLFALGVCAYEILCGRRPFETTPCLFQKLEGRYPPLSELSPALGRKVDAVISKALNAKPALRHATAQDFIADLEAALS